MGDVKGMRVGLSGQTSGIVLAGGASSRMGTSKALLSVKGERLIERTTRYLEQVCESVILSVNDPEPFRYLGLECVPDRYPGLGPMAGIHAGLLASGRRWNLVAACDMPFISPVFLAALLNIAETAEQERGGTAAGAAGPEAIIPAIRGRVHPLLALYRKETAVSLEARLQEGRLRMTEWIGELDAVYVTEKELPALPGIDPDRTLFNMNRPEDYDAARRIAEEDGEGLNTEGLRQAPPPGMGSHEHI